jgi:isocitrate dehydrogenase
MTTYQKVQVPEHGSRIEIRDGVRLVPPNPIIGIIHGDGIGPDITRASLRIWDAAVEKVYEGRRKIAWMRLYAGEEARSLYGESLPRDTLDAISELTLAIKGPLSTPVGEGIRSLNVALRQKLDLYACVRPVHWYPGVPSPLREPHKIDVVIFRENTEDIYAGIEYEAGTPDNMKLARFLREEMGAVFFEGAGLGIKPISEFASKRLMRKAIRYAIDKGRKSVTIMHKGNIAKFTEGAFRKFGYEVAAQEFPEATITEKELLEKHGGRIPEGKVVIKDRMADIMFAQLFLFPEDHSVIAAPNQNGDYISDAAAALVGGMGIAPGVNMSDHVALFEAAHGTAPKYANQDRVNPGALLLSGVMMLEYLGWKEAANAITDALVRTIGEKIVTYDFARQMAGAREVKTSEFADRVIHNLDRIGSDKERVTIGH